MTANGHLAEKPGLLGKLQLMKTAYLWIHCYSISSDILEKVKVSIYDSNIKNSWLSGSSTSHFDDFVLWNWGGGGGNQLLQVTMLMTQDGYRHVIWILIITWKAHGVDIGWYNGTVWASGFWILE